MKNYYEWSIRMSKYLVITDSTADFTPEQIEQLGIEVIPMEFLMEDKTY